MVLIFEILARRRPFCGVGLPGHRALRHADGCFGGGGGWLPPCYNILDDVEVEEGWNAKGGDTEMPAYESESTGHDSQEDLC